MSGVAGYALAGLECSCRRMGCLPPFGQLNRAVHRHGRQLARTPAGTNTADRAPLPQQLESPNACQSSAVPCAAGLASIALEAASGCVVFEEANHAPMELELSHLARLLATAGGGSWRVQLGMRSDAALQQQRACLAVTRTGGCSNHSGGSSNGSRDDL